MDDVLIRTARLSPTQVADATTRRQQAAALAKIEGNPLTIDDVTMFEMFEREGWTPERRRQHILDSIKARAARLSA